MCRRLHHHGWVWVWCVNCTVLAASPSEIVLVEMAEVEIQVISPAGGPVDKQLEHVSLHDTAG